MNRIFFIFLLPLFPACTARHDVAENRETISAETRIAQDRNAWCQNFCEYRVTCTNTDCNCGQDTCYCLEQLDMPQCLQGCAEYFDDYVGRGEACAQEGLDQMDCIETLSCEEMATGNTCEVDSELACGEADLQPEGVAPEGTAIVVCDVHQSDEADPNVSLFECTTEGFDCSDGRDYRVHCVETQDHRGYCMCSVDQAQAGAFYLTELVCPSEAAVNIGCGFGLVPNFASYAPPEDCQGASSSGSPQQGFECSSDFSCANGTFSVICSEQSGSPTCVCYANGVYMQQFTVTDGVCPIGEPGTDGITRINVGCDWNL